MNPAAKSKSFALETAEANSTDTIEKGNDEPVDLPDDSNDAVDEIASQEEDVDINTVDYDDLITSLTADSSINMAIENQNIPPTEVPANHIAYRTHNVTVSGVDISSYSLTISYAQENEAMRLDQDKNIFLEEAAGTTMTAMPNDTWGWAWSDNLASGNEASLTYYGMPKLGTYATDMATGLLSTPVVSNFSVSFTRKLVFGAKFSSDALPGKYHATAMLSLAASPKLLLGQWQLPDGTTKDSGILTMQSMTADVCNQVPTPQPTDPDGSPTLVLRDTRGGGHTNDGVANSYVIAKLSDGKCWMIQNMLLVNTTITSTDSNVSRSYTIPDYSSTGWNSSDYELNKVYLTTANVRYGALYTWFAATAGTGTASLTSSNASGSICPKGWRLPTGGSSGELQALMNNGKFKVGDFADKSSSGWWLGGSKADAPGAAFFSAAGIAQGGSSSQNYPVTFSGAGSRGYYWSSTASGTQAGYFYFTSDYAYANGNMHRTYGYSVRCVAQ